MDNRAEAKEASFTLLCYNVLAQDLADRYPEVYINHEEDHLKWECRWKNLCAEFLNNQADIICLQEVQLLHLDQYIDFFANLGYKGIFKKRTREVYTDGCAIFYKSAAFKLMDHVTVEYYQPSVALLNEDNVGIIAIMAPIEHPQLQFVVATTHLYYNPLRDDVRLAQMQVLLAEIERLAFHQEQRKYLPIVLCGDFNSIPNGGVHKFITEGQVNYENYLQSGLSANWLPLHLGITNQSTHYKLNWEAKEQCHDSDENKLISLHHFEQRPQPPICLLSKDDDKILFNSAKISQSFEFASVFNDLESVTTFQTKWIMVDYIFYSHNHNNLGVLNCIYKRNPFTLATLKRDCISNIPDSKYGSDHFSLFCKFNLKL